jgi:hypothetical protein
MSRTIIYSLPAAEEKKGDHSVLPVLLYKQWKRDND